MLAMLRLVKQLKGLWQPPRGTAASMVGARPGDSVLICGVSRLDLAGEVGAITGLNGQTTVVGRRSHAGALVDAAAAKAGALLDYEDAPLTMLPFDSDRWDAVVIVDGLTALKNDAAHVLSEAVRVTRPGGRIVLCDPIGRPGLFGVKSSPAQAPAAPASIQATLNAAGLRGARLLATVDGIRYFEAIKPRVV